jgi:hypothetical protein
MCTWPWDGSSAPLKKKKDLDSLLKETFTCFLIYFISTSAQHPGSGQRNPKM